MLTRFHKYVIIRLSGRFTINDLGRPLPLIICTATLPVHCRTFTTEINNSLKQKMHLTTYLRKQQKKSIIYLTYLTQQTSNQELNSVLWCWIAFNQSINQSIRKRETPK